LAFIVVSAAVFIIMVPQAVLAQDGQPDDQPKTQTDKLKESCRIGPEDSWIQLQINIPGVTNPQGRVKNLACYIAGFYRYFAIVSGILATVMMMFGGYKYVTSFGNPNRISDAKDNITSAMVGLGLVLGSYLILSIINPALVELKMPKIPPIATLYQDTDWCEEQASATPKVAGATNCGDEGMIAGGGACIYKGDCGDHEICYYVVTAGGYDCYSAENACWDTPVEKCDKTDRQMQRQGIDDKICASLHTVDMYFGVFAYGDKDVCVYVDNLDCKSYGDNWERVYCNYGVEYWFEDATAQLIRHPCQKPVSFNYWHIFGFGVVGNISYSCEVKPRVGEYHSAICCADKVNIHCRSVTDYRPYGCHDDEIAVDCARFPRSQYSDACSLDQINQGMKCCQRVKLIYKND